MFVTGFISKLRLQSFFIRFISWLNHCYWKRDVHLNSTSCKSFASYRTNISNFHPLEVVDRGSETQLQVGEELNKMT